MSGALFAALGVMAAAIVTAVATVLVPLQQGRRSLERERRAHAFDRHLSHYEKIFVAARSAQDAFNDYKAIEQRVSDRSDPFLRQLLAIVAEASYQYCVAVDWRHNPGMAYLAIKLERQCLNARNLLVQWLSQPRITSGDVALIKKNGTLSPVPLGSVRALNLGDYQELRIERRMIVTPDPKDLKLVHLIDKALSSVIGELKAVMAQ